MNSMDHIAILCGNSLAVARTNRLKPGSTPTFYAELAYPPEAAGMLQTIAATVAPGGQLTGLEIGVKLNSQKSKPVPGVPGDWLIVKASTQYAPQLADAAGQPVPQGDAMANAKINATFYAGARVRAALSPYAWSHQQTGRRGISFNLDGVMDTAQGGDRLNVGSGRVLNAFGQYAQPGAAQAQQPVAQPAANPFGQPQQPVQPAAQPMGAFGAGINPFGAGAPAAPSANPFAQAQAAGNPFAR